MIILNMKQKIHKSADTEVFIAMILRVIFCGFQNLPRNNRVNKRKHEAEGAGGGT